MSTPGQAVFLSYASQDAEAAARIAAALRDAGMEVWFDKSELRGGDAWDQKIRRQIKECTLFVPVISKNTDARPEGYFRLEWKLAVDRSHLIADDHAFLVPVIIDDTPEPTARVPDKFRDVQWTRLVMTETPAAFAARMKQLLGGAANIGGQRTEGGGRTKTAHESVWWTRVMPLAGILMGLAFALSPLWKSDRRGSRRPGPPKPAAAAKAEAPVSEARQLMARAKALYEPWDGATREDFALAEQLIKRAVGLDPADGELWATYGLVTCGQVILGHDRAPARQDLARTTTERAVKLAPESVQARFAQAFFFRFNPATVSVAEKSLRQLVTDAPGDKLILRTLGSLLRGQRKYDEAIVYFERAAALPGGDPVAEHNRFITLQNALKFTEAEAVIDAALAKHSAPYLYRDKMHLLVRQHGDLDGAVKVLAKIPAEYLLEDTGAYWASQLRLWRREPDRAIKVWNLVTRDIIETNEFNGPKAFIVGQAHAMAGQKEAAQAEWRAALKVVEQLHAAQPNVLQWVYWQSRIYAALERREDAERWLKTFEQLSGLKGVNDNSIPIYLLLGRKIEVIEVLEKSHAELVKTGNAAYLAHFVNNLRFNHEWDPLREEPRFLKLIEK